MSIRIDVLVTSLFFLEPSDQHIDDGKQKYSKQVGTIVWW